MLVFFLAGFLWLVGFTAMLGGTLLVALQRRPRIARTLTDFEMRPISIIKPLKGLDGGLRGNLKSFFQLNYSRFELIFTIADPEDPARAIVESLIAEFPNVDARLNMVAAHIGENPKVNNLYVPYMTAKHDIILISDSNVRVSQDYLLQLIPNLKRDVSLVTAVIAGRYAKTWGGWLEANYLNTFLARWMHMSFLLRNPIIMGKSMLFRRSELERCGGLRVLANHVAEDYATGLLMKQFGLKTVLMRDTISQHLGDFTLRTFWARHVRWGRIRKSYSLLTFVFEPLSCSVVSGLLGALAFQHFTGGGWALFLFFHLILWCANDLYLIKTSGEKVSVADSVIWSLFECFTIPLWIHSAIGNKIEWRGVRLTLGKSGRLIHEDATLNDQWHKEPFIPKSVVPSKTQEIPIAKSR